MEDHTFLVCSRCDEVIIKHIGDETKIRGKVLIVKEDGVYTVCKGCNAEIHVHLKVDNEMMKSMSEKKQLRLFIKKA